MSVTDLAHAVTSFYEGCRMRATGLLLSRHDIADAGLDRAANAVAVIDAHGDPGRDILIPFLKHHDPMVRCMAAARLHATRRELATPVLLDIHLSCATEAGFIAEWLLIHAGEPNSSGDGLITAWPLKFDDTLYREALERFDRG